VTSIRPRDPATPVQEWVTEVTVASDLNTRDRLVAFLLWAYTGLLAGTLLIYFFQGFALAKFHLDPEPLRWLSAATIGEIGGLLTITYDRFFRQRGGEPYRSSGRASSEKKGSSVKKSLASE
jgi:hypothetical protein